MMRDPRWTVVPVDVSSRNSSSHSKHHLHHHHRNQHHRHVPHHQSTFNPLPPPDVSPSSAVSPARRKCPIHHNTVPHQHHVNHASGMSSSTGRFHATSSRGSTPSPLDPYQDHEQAILQTDDTCSPPEDIVEEKIYIILKSGQSLGCSVVRGPAEYPGIFVQDVKSASPSFKAGLEVGDQILAMNGFSFYPGHYNFDDAINKIKACSQMTLTVRRRVGLHLFHDIKRRNNVHKIRAVVHSSHHPQQHQDSNESDYDPEKDFDLSGICGIHGNGNSQTEVKKVSGLMTISGSHAEEILQKVRLEEERLAEDRRILAAEQQKLQHELRRLAIERKELEAMRLQGKSEDGGSSISSGDVSMLSSSSPDPLASCSVSSSASCNSSTTSSSSSCATEMDNTLTSSSNDSPALGFLDELKQLAEKRSSSDSSLLLDTLKKTTTGVGDATQNSNTVMLAAGLTGSGVGGSRMSRVVKQMVHPDDENRKRHELLMEEFRSAHLRMFGMKSSSLLNRDESSSSCPPSTPTSTTPTTATTTASHADGESGVDHNGKSGSSGSSGSSSNPTDSAIITTSVKHVGIGNKNLNMNGASSATPGKMVNGKNVTMDHQQQQQVTFMTKKNPAVPLSDKTTITAPVTRSPVGNNSGNNVTSSSSSSPSSSSPCSPAQGQMEKRGGMNQGNGEKVMILKTSSSAAVNGNISSRKHHPAPPPPPPPLPGTMVSPPTKTATITMQTKQPSSASSPLVTITSYQTKMRSNNNNRLLKELDPKSSHHHSQQQTHALPVKINLIKSSPRDDK